MKQIISILKHQLIVACHYSPDEPLHEVSTTVAIARAVAASGAAGIRTGGVQEIQAIRKEIDLPIIGFDKMEWPDYSVVRVTPSFESAKRIIEAGADILAMEATGRMRTSGISDEDLIKKIHQELGVPVVADISTLDEGLAAAKAGADLVATTLAGYTPQSKKSSVFDFELLHDLIQHSPVPVIAEGHISSPEIAAQAIQMGAFAVVVGSAITRPHKITKAYVKHIQSVSDHARSER